MAYPDDDSCPLCGEISPDGRAHYRCPDVCIDCGCVANFDEARGCPDCKVNEMFEEMTNDEKLVMRTYFINNGIH